MNKVISALICLTLVSFLAEQAGVAQRFIGVSFLSVLGGLLVSLSIFSNNLKDLSRSLTADSIRLCLLTFIFMFYSLIGVVYSDYDEGLRYVAANIGFLAVAVALSSFLFREKFTTIYIIIFISGLLSVFLFFVSVGVSTSSLGTNKITFISDRNIYVEKFLYALLFTIAGYGYFKGSENTRVYLLYYIGLAIVLILSMFTGSRRGVFLYGVIAAVAPFVVSFFRNKRTKYRFRNVIFLGMLVVGSSVGVVSVSSSESKSIDVMDDVTMFVLGDIFNSRSTAEKIISQGLTSRTLGVLTGESDYSAREDIWREALVILSDYNFLELIVGRGTGSFYTDMTRQITPHNFALASMMEGGILKLLIALLIVYQVLSLIMRLVRVYDIWTSCFIFASGIIWLVSVSISGGNLFSHKTIYMLLSVYLVFEAIAVRRAKQFSKS